MIPPVWLHRRRVGVDHVDRHAAGPNLLRFFEDELADFPLFGQNRRVVALVPRLRVEGAIHAPFPESEPFSRFGDGDDLFCEV